MKTILLIEDNRDILDNLLEFFELEGYNVLAVNNGKDGVELAIKHVPDLIICDFIMSQMNGQKVLELILNSSETCKIPFIFCTSMSETSDIVNGLKFGAHAYIVKPFEIDNVLEIAKELMLVNDKTKSIILPLKSIN